MSIKEVKIENTVICYQCRKVYIVENWKPTDTLKKKCPNCKRERLYWAVRDKED